MMDAPSVAPAALTPSTMVPAAPAPIAAAAPTAPAPSAPAEALAHARLAVLRSYRDAGGERWLGATGDSMAPLIRHGDELLVQFGPVRPAAGRIVLFGRDGLVVAHRILAPTPQGPGPSLLTKGDAVVRGVEHLAASEVLGVVIAVRPAGRRSSQLGCSGRGAAVTARLALAAERLRPGRRSRRAWPLKLLSHAPSGLARAALRSWTWCLVTTRRVESMRKGGEST